MASISFVAQASAATTSVTLPTHNVGDYIIIIAYRTATSAPSLPAGYTSILTSSGNANSFTIGYKVATGSDTSGTWTNATGVAADIYRGVGAIGASSGSTHAASTTITLPALTLTDTSGSSWVVGMAASKATTISTPTGTTQRSSQAITGGLIKVVDTNGGVTSWATHTATNGSSTVTVEAAFELIHSELPPVAPTLSSPANAGTVATTTPTLDFSTTDPDADTVTYEVQVDSVSTFNSVVNTPAVVQRKTGTDAATGTVSAAFTSSNTSGNTIIAAATINNTLASPLSGISDSQGNTYSLLLDYDANAPAFGMRIWISTGIKSGSNTVSVNDTSHNSTLHTYEISGLVSINTLDVSSTNGSLTSSASQTSGTTPTTSSAIELLLGFVMTNIGSVTFSAGSGYSNLQNATVSGLSSGSEEQITSSAGTYAATFTSSTSVQYAAVVIGLTGTGPAIDALSNTAAGFTDITNGADTDPFASGDQIGYTVGSTNLFPNPSFETNTTGWASFGTGSSITASATHALSGTESCAVTTTTTGTTGLQSSTLSGLTAGTVYTFSAYIFAPGGTIVTAEIDTSTSGGSFVNTHGFPTISGNSAWQRLTLTFTMDATASQAVFFLYTNNIGTYYVDAAQLETGSSATTYFDGDNAPPGLTTAWTGTANASTSTSSLTNGTTCYWRVRGKDPLGSNTFGAYSSTNSFTVSTGGGGPSPSQFFQFF